MKFYLELVGYGRGHYVWTTRNNLTRRFNLVDDDSDLVVARHRCAPRAVAQSNQSTFDTQSDAQQSLKRREYLREATTAPSQVPLYIERVVRE
jgi:hypothetical protein